jgi:serine/threonine-protein kinase HipA
VTKLDVWMYGIRVGTLARQRGQLTFTYAEEALDAGLGRPLVSVSMPTRPRSYRGAIVEAFFDGLLPEGETRRMIAFDFGVPDTDVFGLLGAIGRDCAGALVVVPELSELSSTGTAEPITDAEVAGRIRNLRLAPLGVDEKVRVSLAGMQQKLLLARTPDGWALPVNGAPSTHLLKPTHSFLPNTIENEALCMRVAHHLGMAVADVAVESFEDRRVLVVTRFDRAWSEASQAIERIHQEDMCQAHAIDSRRKYEGANGPSLRSCAETTEAWSRESQLGALLDLVTLNVLVGNCDAHAKNLSLLHCADERLQLAPAYDVMSTVYYENVETTLGMFINGVRDIRDVSRDDLIREGAGWGLHQDAAAQRIEQLLSHAEDAILRASEDVPAPDDLVELLTGRARFLAPQTA